MVYIALQSFISNKHDIVKFISGMYFIEMLLCVV